MLIIRSKSFDELSGTMALVPFFGRHSFQRTLQSAVHVLLLTVPCYSCLSSQARVNFFDHLDAILKEAQVEEPLEVVAVAAAAVAAAAVTTPSVGQSHP